MPDLTRANEARLNAALDRRYRFTFGESSFRQAIADGRFNRAEQGTKPGAQWDRRKFNRMDGKQQAEYQRKLDSKVTVYRLYFTDCPHGSWVDAPKSVFDWYVSRQVAES